MIRNFIEYHRDMTKIHRQLLIVSAIHKLETIGLTTKKHFLLQVRNALKFE